MTKVFSLFREQQDDQIKSGNPTRLLGFFSTKKLAQKALDAIQLGEPDAVGTLVIYPHVLGQEGFNEGFVTEYLEDD